MKFSGILLLFVLPLYFLSCKPVQQLPYYLDKVNDSTGKGLVTSQELKIQKNDLLSIAIASLSTKPDISDAIYNQPAAGGSTVGYLVDGEGNIEHHRLGLIKAEGLTKLQLANEIKKRLTVPVELLKDPTVIIRFLNFKVTILGQVGKEGPVTVPGERLTILEAIGLAGGITDYGKKDHVKVVREINGQRETGIVDLSSKDIFDSPYYHLMQNDL
jgi:polysaccharide export outer membrane protein